MGWVWRCKVKARSARRGRNESDDTCAEVQGSDFLPQINANLWSRLCQLMFIHELAHVKSDLGGSNRVRPLVRQILPLRRLFISSSRLD